MHTKGLGSLQTRDLEPVVAHPETVKELKEMFPHLGEYQIARALQYNDQDKAAAISTLLTATPMPDPVDNTRPTKRLSKLEEACLQKEISMRQSIALKGYDDGLANWNCWGNGMSGGPELTECPSP
mmetsp:Transcript_16516/g.35899  ORF Transcript_16516/g.35899 Transcript_16516/m.35899 type:complete len:126 (+) Transcript_16516:630-1007(+)